MHSVENNTPKKTHQTLKKVNSSLLKNYTLKKALSIEEKKQHWWNKGAQESRSASEAAIAFSTLPDKRASIDPKLKHHNADHCPRSNKLPLLASSLSATHNEKLEETTGDKSWTNPDVLSWVSQEKGEGRVRGRWECFLSKREMVLMLLRSPRENNGWEDDDDFWSEGRHGNRIPDTV